MFSQKSDLHPLLSIFIHIHGWKEALKSALVTSDGNQMNVLDLSEAVMKPVTFMMSLLPGMMMNLNALTEK